MKRLIKIIFVFLLSTLMSIAFCQSKEVRTLPFKTINVDKEEDKDFQITFKWSFENIKFSVNEHKGSAQIQIFNQNGLVHKVVLNKAKDEFIEMVKPLIINKNLILTYDTADGEHSRGFVCRFLLPELDKKWCVNTYGPSARR